jgi:ankyrin repeat protein
LPDGTGVVVTAVTNAHFELAARLVKRGADPNAAKQGWTALHQLAWTRRPNRGFANPGPSPTGRLDGLSLVKELVTGGADPNARQTKEPRDGYRNLLNRVGATPFLLAAKSADVDLMRALVAAGADPRLTTADHTTPLMAAAGVGIWAVGESPGTSDEALKAVQYALELGGDVTAVNDYGYTALHGAAHRGAPALVELLAAKGAKLDAALTKTGGGGVGWKEGWTPLAIAEGLFYANSYKRHPETAALLRRLVDERSSTVPAAQRRN